MTVLNGLKACQLSYGDWVAVPGAGGGLGHLAVQYAIATGMKVVGIDTGAEKKKLVEGYGGVFIDFKEEKVSGRGHIASSELTRRTGYRCRRKESNGRQRAARSIDICCIRRSIHHGELFVSARFCMTLICRLATIFVIEVLWRFWGFLRMPN